jgi:hypothetical protein
MVPPWPRYSDPGALRARPRGSAQVQYVLLPQLAATDQLGFLGRDGAAAPSTDAGRRPCREGPRRATRYIGPRVAEGAIAYLPAMNAACPGTATSDGSVNSMRPACTKPVTSGNGHQTYPRWGHDQGIARRECHGARESFPAPAVGQVAVDDSPGSRQPARDGIRAPMSIQHGAGRCVRRVGPSAAANACALPCAW